MAKLYLTNDEHSFQIGNARHGMSQILLKVNTWLFHSFVAILHVTALCHLHPNYITAYPRGVR